MIKAMVGALLLAATVAASAADAAQKTDASGQTTWPLAREHVNLVRVKNERITDVVFDAEALEVSADKAKGIVFVRVKKKWLESASGEVTSAYFTTESDVHSVRFVVSAVPSQTIDLEGSTKEIDEKRKLSTNSTNDKALDMPLASFGQSAYVEELKALVRLCVRGKTSEEVSGPQVFSQNDRGRWLALNEEDQAAHLDGLSIRTTRAYLTADKLCEAVRVRNMTPQSKKLNAARLIEKIPGVLAVASSVDRLNVGEASEVIVVRSRAAAVMQSQTGVKVFHELIGN